METSIWKGLQTCNIIPNSNNDLLNLFIIFILGIIMIVVILIGLFFSFQYKETESYINCFESNKNDESKKIIDNYLLTLQISGFIFFAVLFLLFFYIFFKNYIFPKEPSVI